MLFQPAVIEVARLGFAIGYAFRIIAHVRLLQDDPLIMVYIR